MLKDSNVQQEMPETPKTKSGKKALVIVGVIFGLLILGLVIYTGWPKVQKTTVAPNASLSSNQPVSSSAAQNSQKIFTPDVKNEVFVATTEDGFLNVLIFNPAKNKIIVSKRIALDAFLSNASANLYGANDSVQYNPKTKEIFFSTRGYSEYDGSCTNRDGTCVSRLYKIGLYQTRPTILFESLNPPTNWIVNSFDNSLLLSFWRKGKQKLQKISGQNGKVIFTKEYQIKKYTTLANFVLSKNGNFTYQVSKESINGKWFREILKLRKIDNSNGNVTEQRIFNGEAIECETDLSPNNNYLAFYSGTQRLAKLHIYKIPTKELISVPYQGSIANYNLFWSGNSEKLLYLLKNSLTYYDIPTSKSVLVSGDPRQARYVYAWAPSTNYFIYQSQDGEIKIFDMLKKQVIDTRIKAEIEPKGISWY